MDGYADWIGPAMTPESPPSAAPKANTTVNTRPMSMPSPAVISASYTPARMTAPRRVLSITSQSRTASEQAEGDDEEPVRGEGETAEGAPAGEQTRAAGSSGCGPPSPT